MFRINLVFDFKISILKNKFGFVIEQIHTTLQIIMTFKKDICVSKTRNIWIDYEHNHMFYITNLMDILPPEIAEDIWKTYWKYEYRKNFIREAMWKDLYMNRIKWAASSPILHNHKYKI